MKRVKSEEGGIKSRASFDKFFRLPSSFFLQAKRSFAI